MQHKGELMDDHADVFDVSDHEDLDLEGTMSLATKAKQLAQVDHTRVYYRPFRRDFYIEVPELAKMTEEGTPQGPNPWAGGSKSAGRVPRPLPSCGGLKVWLLEI